VKIFGIQIGRDAAPAGEARGLTEDLLEQRSLNLRAGTSLSTRGAMGITAVYACVDLLSKLVAMLPWSAMIKSGSSRMTADDHPLHALLAIRPNSYQTPYVFRRQMMLHLLLWGNFFAEIQRDRRTGDPIGLFPIHPSEVTVRLDKGVKSYVARGVPMADDDIFHIFACSFDGIRGVSPIAMHRSTLNLSMEAMSYAESFFRNGAQLSGYVQHPGKLTAEAAARFSGSFSRAYAGAANAGKVPVLEEGMEFKPLSMPLADAQFVEQRKMQIAEAARIFGVPLHKLAEMDGAKFNNIEQQNISLLIDCVQPIVTSIEQEANYKLIHQDERARLYTRFNLSVILRSDLKSRMEAYAIMRQWAILTIDEIRALEDMNPLPEGGENPFVGGNAQATASPGAAAAASITEGQ
jgi:HK97 family phage portal protein